MTRLVPVLDLARLDQGPSEKRTFLADLRAAARDVGFFYLAGHGIAQSEIDGVFRAAQRFFKLPDADKQAIAMVNSSQFRGYTRTGGELTGGKPDWREQFDIGVEREPLSGDTEAPAWTRLQGPNQWPRALPELRADLLAWQSRATGIAIRVLEAFALALDQPIDAFEAIYRDKPNHRMKIVRYPGREEPTQGVGAHKDGGFLTLLLQDENRGLQVEYDGAWVDVEPIPGTLVVNIGELLELASNGYLRATVHHVLAPPSGTERLSVPFFFGAQLDATIPLIELPEELATQAQGPASDPDNPLFRDVGTNVLKSRLRSHPDVAQRHYADLLENGFLRP